VKAIVAKKERNTYNEAERVRRKKAVGQQGIHPGRRRKIKTGWETKL
jgi:hypothetical protein